MEFKLAKKSDAEKVYTLVQETIKVVYPKYYLKEIVGMFCEFHSLENIIKDIEAGNTYILVENEEIIGTGTKIENHITRVYVLPRYQKRGYGTFIMNQLEELIKEKYDCADIDASLPACRLYMHLGYQTVDHGIWECKNGVIQVYEIMKKQLINGPLAQLIIRPYKPKDAEAIGGKQGMNYLENYYANYDEEGRLASKHGQVEFLTTMKYIHEFIGGTEKKKILEVGAGTGRYSIALALEGHEVDALEYTTHNLEIMNSKIAGITNIRTCQGTALDLSGFADESFDMTLVLGPMYHMYTKENKQKVLEEAIRVTKKQGHILVAYCMNEATMIQYTFKAGKIWDCVNNHMLTDDFRCISEEKDLFEMVRLEEIDELNACFENIKRLKIVAADGATNYMRECVNAMDDATFDMWMRYHFSICERMDLIGATNHALDILVKN